MGILLADGEKPLFDSLAVEIGTLAGVDSCVLWHVTAYTTVPGAVDLLYNEPTIGSKHYTPYTVLALYEAPTQNQEATDQGLNKTSDGKITFIRANLEKVGVPVDNSVNNDRVLDGDIIQLFKAGTYWYFELKNTERTGWINDSKTFTHYVCDMIRVESFIPERKLAGGP